MKKNLLLLLSSFIIFSSCEKDEIEKNEEISNVACFPIEITYDNNTYLRKFSYNAEGQVIRDEIFDNTNGGNTSTSYYVYEYEENKLIKKSLLNSQNTMYQFTSFEYNSSNQLVKSTLYWMSNGKLVVKNWFTYEYNSPKELRKVSFYIDNTLDYYFTYQYTNGLMTKSQSFSANGTARTQYEYEYDNKKGVASSMHSALIHFGDMGFPYKHNIIKVTAKNPNGDILNGGSELSTLEYDLNGYPTKRMNGGDTSRTYKYSCK